MYEPTTCSTIHRWARTLGAIGLSTGSVAVALTPLGGGSADASAAGVAAEASVSSDDLTELAWAGRWK